MEIKRRAEYDYQTDNIIEFILRSRGVKKEDVKHFLFPDSSLEADWRKLDNIDEGLALLKKHVDKVSHIRIGVDMDMDGFSSASIMYQFLAKDLGHENVSYYVPSHKVHGINLQDTLEHNPDLLIIPDAGSGEFDIHKQLREAGIDVLVLDHHLVDGNRYSEDAVVINNQLSYKFESKALTGASIVYLFVQAYIENYSLDVDYKKYIDLATIGMISDRADLTDKVAFYYSQVGLKKIKNPLIRYIMEKSNRIEGDSLTPKNVGFDIAPLLNAMTREGRKEDIDLVVDALFGKDYKVYNKRLKGEFPVVEEAFRRMNNTKARQNKKVKEAMEQIEERVTEMGTHENQVLMVNSTGIIEESGINGLVAIQLSNKYNRPTLVLQYNENKGILQGSGRNFNNSPVEDFRQLLEDTGMFQYASGHAGAFGVGIELDEAMEVVDELNDILSDIEYNNLSYEVDLIYSERPDVNDIIEITKYKHMWGNKLDAPMIYVDRKSVV